MAGVTSILVSSFDEGEMTQSIKYLTSKPGKCSLSLIVSVNQWNNLTRSQWFRRKYYL